MRTLKAVVAGFAVTSGLIVLGSWIFREMITPAARGGYYTPTVSAGIALLYTAAGIIVGAFVAARIHDSNETISGFIVAQAFFGFGLIREFWSNGSSWYTVSAVVLVIPCAIFGRALARRISGRARAPRSA